VVFIIDFFVFWPIHTSAFREEPLAKK